MSFGDHLEELRKRLLLSIIPPLPLFMVIFALSDTLLQWLLLPVHRVLAKNGLPPDLQVLSPPELLATKLKLSLISAIVISAPWILWQFWKFVAPGLYRHERRFVHFLIPGSALLTVAGVALLYYVMLPLMLHVLVAFTLNVDFKPTPPTLEPDIAAIVASINTPATRLVAPDALTVGDAWVLWPDMALQVVVAGDEGTPVVRDVERPMTGKIQQNFRVSFVVNFVLVLLMGITIAFQMPLVILLLGWLDLVRVSFLQRNRRYALVACAAVSALITPAEATSMILMLIPLYALYELGILLLRIAPASRVADGDWRPKVKAAVDTVSRSTRSDSSDGPPS